MKKRLFVIGQLVPLLAASVLCMAGAQSPVLSGWGISAHLGDCCRNAAGQYIVAAYA